MVPRGSIRNVAGIVRTPNASTRSPPPLALWTCRQGMLRDRAKSVSAARVSSRLTPTTSKPASRYFA